MSIIDVVTVSEAGRCGGEDAEVLADATADGRAVLTHNHNHFRRLQKAVRAHAGIISCTRDDQDLPGLARRIHDAVAPTLADQFIRIIRPRQTLSRRPWRERTSRDRMNKPKNDNFARHSDARREPRSISACVGGA